VTLLNLSATPGIVTTTIGSRAEVSADAPEQELSGSLKGSEELRSISTADTSPVLHNYSWDSDFEQNSPICRVYSTTHLKVKLPKQPSQLES